jgi:hypothetical protein
MKSQARELILACLLPVAVFSACWLLAASWYSVDLSGIPDEGQVPTGLLPWFLYSYRSGGNVWSDAVRTRTWLVSCAGYAIPAAIATYVPRRPTTRAWAFLVAVALILWATTTIPIPSPPAEHRAFYTASTVLSARLWIVALGIAGAIVGLAARTARRSSRSASV